jgi:hypothetical protein
VDLRSSEEHFYRYLGNRLESERIRPSCIMHHTSWHRVYYFAIKKKNSLDVMASHHQLTLSRCCSIVIAMIRYPVTVKIVLTSLFLCLLSRSNPLGRCGLRRRHHHIEPNDQFPTSYLECPGVRALSLRSCILLRTDEFRGSHLFLFILTS